jgi:hypothetical protein
MKLDKEISLAELPDSWSLNPLKDVVVLRADVARVGCSSCPSRGIHQL